MSFKEYKTLDLTEISNKISDYWDKDKTFKKSISSRDNSEDFVFFEGPPSANGMPGIHHVMARAIKDIFCRYKTLKGFKDNSYTLYALVCIELWFQTFIDNRSHFVDEKK